MLTGYIMKTIKKSVLCRFGGTTERNNTKYLEIFFYQRPTPFSVKKDSLRKKYLSAKLTEDQITQKLKEDRDSYVDFASQEGFDIEKGTFCGHLYIKLEDPESVDGLNEYQLVAERVRGKFPGSKSIPCCPWFYFLNELVYKKSDITEMIKAYKEHYAKIGSVEKYVELLKSSPFYKERGCFPASISTVRGIGKSQTFKYFNLIKRVRDADSWQDYMTENIEKRLESVQTFVKAEDKFEFGKMFDAPQEPVREGYANVDLGYDEEANGIDPDL